MLFGSENYQNDRSNSCHSMNILSIEYSHEFKSCKRDAFESSLLRHAFYTKTIQVCPRQWDYVCNSRGVLFGSESYQNDRSNSCQSMNILSIKYSHEFQSCKRDVFESLLEYSMPFKHKQSRLVRNSGSMSATVADHGDQILIRTAQKLIVTARFYSVRKGSSRTLTITYYFIIKMCWKNINSFDSMSKLKIPIKGKKLTSNIIF